MFATQVLPETLSDDSEEESQTTVGFIVIDDKKHEVRKGETKIGRDSSMCSIVIENFTVSKVHAIIESDGTDDTFIYDVGSTNQTRLGKKVLKPHCRYKLDNDSIITLGSVIVKFILTPDKTILDQSNKDNWNSLDECGDIFEVATQAVAPQPNASSRIIALENQSKYIQTFENQNTKEPDECFSQSVFELRTQCRLDSKEPESKTENDSSGIFSLPTQCQIYKPQAVTEINSESNSQQAADELQSLLNDGQDDALCAVLSLHSPKGLGDGVVKNIKTEIEDLSQVLDAPTQVQADVTEPQGEKDVEMNVLLQDRDLTSTSSCLPISASTPLNRKLTKNVSENNSCIQDDEDFIKTQEFAVGESHKDSQRDNLSQDDVTQPYLGRTLANNSTTEQKSDNEDFVLTQSFETRRQDPLNDRPAIVIPESEDFDEDFMETQIYDIEKEIKPTEEVVTKMRAPPSAADCTQRNIEEDFDATQLFKEPTGFNRIVGNSERSVPSDDEDFIATQIAELPKNINTNSQETRTDEASRESSPDLLALGNPSRDSEDCVSNQSFESTESHNSNSSSFFSEKFKSMFFGFSKKDETSNVKTKAPATVESSGDETESDLEVLLDKHEIIREDGKFKEISPKIEFESFQNHKRGSSPASQVSNDSYVFELQPQDNSEETQAGQEQKSELTDSDATDCEEIAVLGPEVPIKQETLQPVEFEDTQVLTLTPPNNFTEKTADTSLTGGQSPEFQTGNYEEAWSPLSLEMPSSLDMETSLKRRNESAGREKSENLGTPSSKIQKIEVGLDSVGSGSFWKFEPSEKKVHTPKKRSLDCDEVQVVAVKKSKTEDNPLKSSENRLSRLVRYHDISDIRPNRTRNSVKNVKPETKPRLSSENDPNIVRPNSRRKINTRGSSKILNCDVTPNPIKRGRKPSCGGQRKEATPSEKGSKAAIKTEVGDIRTSKRISTSPCNSLKPLENAVSTRKSKRNSWRKKSDNFERPAAYVAFTGFDSVLLSKMLSDLGGKKVNDLSGCEVMVADKVRRTVKFLCAIGLSLPITSPQWLVACKKEEKFLNPWDFILKDEEAENKWDFKLKTSLERSKRGKLFDGFSIFATKSTKPPVKDLLAIVECCGGTPIFEPPEVWPKKTIIVSCLEDKKFWPAAKLRNVQVVHYEFILSGVLQQKIDFKTHKLR